MRDERGFTMIDLLTVMATIGALAGLGVQTFKDYKNKAAYSVAAHTLRDARTAYESSNAEGGAYPYLTAAQTTPGVLSDALARDLMKGFVVPNHVKVTLLHEPACGGSAGCIEQFLQINHCHAKQFTNWTRYGDGSEILLEHVNGSGCA